jgi:S-adenosylmethionine decarboxylase
MRPDPTPPLPADGPLTLGRHWLVECHNVPPARLDDHRALEPLFVDAARAARATVLGSHFHRFEPQGVSGVVLLAESHLTVHTWPEHRYAAVDLFSCSDHIRVEPVLSVLRGGLGSDDLRVSAALARGLLCPAPLDPRSPEPQLSWRARHQALAPTNLHLAVDVEGCPPSLLASNLLAPLAVALREGLGDVNIDPPLLRDQGAHRTIFASFPEGHLTAALSPAEGTARVDLLTRAFVDPLPLGLRLRALFQGQHHALRCTFRR